MSPEKITFIKRKTGREKKRKSHTLLDNRISQELTDRMTTRRGMVLNHSRETPAMQVVDHLRSGVRNQPANMAKPHFY